MSASLPYSVVIANDKVLPQLKVVGNLDVGGDLTVTGLTTANGGLIVNGTNYINGTLQISNSLTLEGGCELLSGPYPQSAGTIGQYLTSQGSTQSPTWTSTIAVAPVIFHGKRAANLVLGNTTDTLIGTLTDDLINQGSGFNSATGRFTCPITGYYNLFCAGQFSFTGNNGQETNSYLRIYNASNVLQREYTSQNYAPTTPEYGGLVSSININYYLPTNYYVTFSVWTEDTTAPATQLTTNSYFGGSRFAD